MKRIAILLGVLMLSIGLMAQNRPNTTAKTSFIPCINGVSSTATANPVQVTKTSIASMMRLDSIIDNGPYGRKQIFTYDNLGKVLQYVDYEWSTGWQPYYREDFDYDNQNRISLITSYDGSSSWVPDKKELFMYDQTTGRLNEKTREDWDIANLIWKNDQKRFYTYSPEGWLEFEVAYSWEDTTWVYSWMNEYTYDAAGNQIERLNSWWGNQMWNNSMLDEYSYNGQGLLMEHIYSYWMTPGGWHQSGKYIYTYNANQQVTEELSFEWNGQWDYYSKVEWFYTAALDIDYQIFSYYDNGGWELSQKLDLIHDITYSFQDLILPWNMLEEGGQEYFAHKLDKYTMLNYVNGNWTIDSDNDLYYSAYSGVGLPEALLAGCFVYPNPAVDFILVEVPNGQSSTFSLFDISGKCVLTKQIDQNQPLNICSLPAGVYIWQLQQGKQTFRGKLLKD